MEVRQQKMGESFLEGFSPVSSTPVLWKSRKRSGKKYYFPLYSLFINLVLQLDLFLEMTRFEVYEFRI